MIYFFIAVVCLLIYAEYKIERRFVNLFSIFGFPYLFLVIVNNFVVYQTGFYKISDAVLLMVLSALVFFFIGMLLAYPKLYTNIGDVEDGKMLSFYNIKAMTIILYLIGTIGLLKVGYLYLTGAFSVVNIDDAEGVMGNGIVGHLLIFSYSILPIVFLYWTYHPKKFYYFIPVLMIVIVAFSSLIKYNVIGVVVTLFIFTIIYRRSLLKRAVITLISIVVGLFVGNYSLGFFLSDNLQKVENTFYVNHLWKYMAGSLIYDNYIFTTGIRTEVSLDYKLMTFLCALPNMFTSKFFDFEMYLHQKQGFRNVTNTGETSNVTDAIGYIYPSKGDGIELFFWCTLFIMLGFLSAWFYKSQISRKNRYSTALANFLTYFVFFSFFGTFYINPGVWEILVFALIVPPLFYKRTSKK